MKILFGMALSVLVLGCLAFYPVKIEKYDALGALQVAKKYLDDDMKYEYTRYNTAYYSIDTYINGVSYILHLSCDYKCSYYWGSANNEVGKGWELRYINDSSEFGLYRMYQAYYKTYNMPLYKYILESI